MRILFFILMLFSLSSHAAAQWKEGLDPAFGSGGIVSLDMTWIRGPGLYSNFVQPDGKIVLCSSSQIIRLMPDGSFDGSFSSGGFFVHTFYRRNGTPILKFGTGNPALMSDGRIVAVGGDNDSSVAFVYRIFPDGSVDTSFGFGGRSEGSKVEGGGVGVQPDTKVFTVATLSGGQRLERYRMDGRGYDSTFGVYGHVYNDSIDGASGFALMPDGRFVASGRSFDVARYLPDGRLDTSFNHRGYNWIFPRSLGSPYSTCMALCPDGKVWIAGTPLFGGGKSPFILARFNADGSVDSSFNGVGYREYPIDTGDENKCRDMLLLPDGKVLLGGRAMNRITKQYNFMLIRIHPDGREDSSFGINGRLMTQTGIADGSYKADDALKLLRQADGKIIASGFTFDGKPSSTVIRYHASGKSGIQDFRTASIKVFPNPAREELEVVTNGADRLLLTDMMGRVWIKVDRPDAQQKLQLGKLPSGVYLLVLERSGSFYREKISVVHE